MSAKDDKHMRMSASDLLREDGQLIEFVRAAVTADDLSKGVDLVRTRPNEVSMIQGRIQTYQLWQAATLTSDPPTIDHATLSVGDAVLSLSPGNRRRFDRVRLVKPGSSVRALVRAPEVRQLSIVSLEIFGWEVLESWLPEVEEALRAMESS